MLKDYLKEITLTRVYRHFKNVDIPVAIITAFRSERSYDDNISMNKALAAEIKNVGYGYVYVDGHWIETGKENERINVKEDSILIIGRKNDNGRLKGFLKKWIKKYEQEAALFKNENSYSIGILDSYGKFIVISKKFSLKELEIGYTKLRGRGGRVFSFNEERDDTNWIGKMKEFLEKKD